MKTTTELSNYEKQAIDFMTAVGARMEVEFLENGFHFEGDKEKRDIYQITLINAHGREFKFRFGNSLNDSGFYYTKGVKKTDIDRTLLGASNSVAKIKAKDWDFLNNGKSDKIHYPVAPNSYSVLACLTKYDPGTFENFCHEFGYDTDSRKALKTYKAVQNEWLNIERLFTESEIELLREIQ